jgi:cytochrome c oxidase cbb3-type subunit 3
MTFHVAMILLSSDPGTDIALLVTSLVTALSVALVFLVLLIPEEDRRRLTEGYARLKRYVLTGSSERAVLFDHDYDGIQELDNRIPPWFTTLFLATIIFGIIYMLNFHVFHSSKLSADEYKDELARAELHRRVLLASEGSIDEGSLVALTAPDALKVGGENFHKYCVSCHGNFGQGLVGPNLTDDFWIHGGGIKNVYTTIKQGVPAKGMISWQLVFTPKQIQELASYVLTLRGTNPPGAKKPQGERYVEADTTRKAL